MIARENVKNRWIEAALWFGAAGIVARGIFVAFADPRVRAPGPILMFMSVLLVLLLARLGLLALLNR